MTNKERDAGVFARPLLRRLENHEVFPLAALEAIAEARKCLSAIEREAVAKAREMGASWEDVAFALGVSRQTLYQRYRNDHFQATKSP